MNISSAYRRQYLCLFLVLISPFSLRGHAASISGRDVISSVEELLWGGSVEGLYTMTIVTPYWKRTLNLHVWMERPEKSFVRILSPVKEKGIGSLRLKNEMWNYLPKVERTLKVPPSMMLQPWMGSDFSNDDLVKASRVIEDYKHTLVATEEIHKQLVYRIESIPKPESAVVWGKLVYRVRVADLMPINIEYFDERGRLIKTLIFSDVRQIGGRILPTKWQMQPTARPGNSTTVKIEKVTFDQPISGNIFTLRNLRKY